MLNANHLHSEYYTHKSLADFNFNVHACVSNKLRNIGGTEKLSCVCGYHSVWDEKCSVVDVAITLFGMRNALLWKRIDTTFTTNL